MPVGGVPQGYQQRNSNQQSCLKRVGMGCGMGFCVGATTGLFLGGFMMFRSGVVGRERLKLVAKSMAQAGFSFGIFMGVGTALRC